MQVTINDQDVHYKLDVSKPLLFLTHGWTDNVNRTWVKDIVGDYVTYIGGNICAVDWSRLALVEYNLAARNTPKVGRYLAKFVKFLLKQGFSMDQLTLVGHSMGAHISGIAGAALDGAVPMIVGLDPAGPSFTRPFLVSTDRRLDKSDALFVQAVHTDKNIIGTSTNVGHQDFYTNNGASPQPGCEFPLVNNDTTKAYREYKIFFCKVVGLISMYFFFFSSVHLQPLQGGRVLPGLAQPAAHLRGHQLPLVLLLPAGRVQQQHAGRLWAVQQVCIDALVLEN